MAKIDEKSSINLFAVLVALPVLFAAILYVVTIGYTAVNAEKVNDQQDIAIKENRNLIDDNEKKVMGTLFEINARTIRIEERQKKGN